MARHLGFLAILKTRFLFKATYTIFPDCTYAIVFIVKLRFTCYLNRYATFDTEMYLKQRNVSEMYLKQQCKRNEFPNTSELNSSELVNCPILRARFTSVEDGESRSSDKGNN